MFLAVIKAALAIAMYSLYLRFSWLAAISSSLLTENLSFSSFRSLPSSKGRKSDSALQDSWRKVLTMSLQVFEDSEASYLIIINLNLLLRLPLDLMLSKVLPNYLLCLPTCNEWEQRAAFGDLKGFKLCFLFNHFYFIWLRTRFSDLCCKDDAVSTIWTTA